MRKKEDQNKHQKSNNGGNLEKLIGMKRAFLSFFAQKTLHEQAKSIFFVRLKT